MTRASIINLLDRQAQKADRLFGQRAEFSRRTEGELDIVTGLQNDTVMTKQVWVRSWPLSLRERVDLSNAGILQVDARFTMRTAYEPEIEPGDTLKVGSLVYEIVEGGISTDEHHVEHTLLTQRRR